MRYRNKVKQETYETVKDKLEKKGLNFDEIWKKGMRISRGQFGFHRELTTKTLSENTQILVEDLAKSKKSKSLIETFERTEGKTFAERISKTYNFEYVGRFDTFLSSFSNWEYTYLNPLTKEKETKTIQEWFNQLQNGEFNELGNNGKDFFNQLIEDFKKDTNEERKKYYQEQDDYHNYFSD